jgi:tetratricopeptide (TPR) repeat protein
MTTPRATFVLLSATLILSTSPGCRKEKTPETTTPDAPAETTTSSGVVRPTLPPQAATPSALDDAIATMLGGNAQAALAQLQPMYDGIADADETLAARTFVGSWVVVGHCSVLLPENGDDLLNSMKQWTARLESAAATEATTARALTTLAEGALHKAFGDFEEAIVSFEAVSNSSSPWRDLATLWLAEATLNSAYREDGEGIERPEKIDEARPLYERALNESTRDIVRGMANEGLAVVAELKRNRSEACEYATAALAAYEKSGASDYRLESPQLTLEKNRCE